MTFFRKIGPSGSRITREQFYKNYLHLLNAVLPAPLTETEIDILIHIYFSGKILTSGLRKKIRDTLSISEKNLNNFVSKLKKKSVIVGNTINEKYLPPKADGNDPVNSFVIYFQFDVGENNE